MNPAMLDDFDLLRSNANLLQLLGLYVELAAANAEAWQDRVMVLEGCEPRELTKLHGLLLGFGWLEQNTGHTPVLRADSAPACYRITSAGFKAFRDVQGMSAEDMPIPVPTFPRKKRKKTKESEPATEVARS